MQQARPGAAGGTDDRLSSMRVLISAYVCMPGSGSEPGAGWEFVRAACRGHEVTVLTQPTQVEATRSALLEEGLASFSIVPVPVPPWLEPYEGRLGLGHLNYVVWQARASRVARQLRHGFDVAHHVTYGNDWMPSLFHFVPGLPLVWGPVGGASSIAWSLARYLSPWGVVQEAAREALTRPLRALTRALVRRSRGLVVAANRDVAEQFSDCDSPVVIEPTAAMPPAPTASSARGASGGSRRAIFVGRLMAWKGPYLALDAFHRLPPDWQLDFYGEGPEMARIGHRAERLGIGARVRLLGLRPRTEIWEALEQADLLLFPAMHDPQPYVVAEAVRVGCPVVCLDLGGAPALIGETSGIAVPPTGAVADALAAAMVEVGPVSPSDRWNAARLPGLVSDWYEAATRNGGRQDLHTPTSAEVQ